MSESEASEVDDDFEDEDVIVIKRYAKDGKSVKSPAKSSNCCNARHLAELDRLMTSLMGRLQEWQGQNKKTVREYVKAWLDRVTQAPSTLNCRKLPVCWVYSGTIHSIEVNAALRDLATSAATDGCNLVELTPEDLGSPKASNKLAKLIYSRLSPSSVAPGSHYTLQHVAALCAERTQERSNKHGGKAGAAEAPALILVLPDITIAAQRPLQQLMHALSDLRQAGSLRPALVVGAAQHPDAVRPLLSAEGARAHAYMRPVPYKLPSSLESLSSLMQHTQVDLAIPEVLLGPHVLRCMARVVSRTELCQGTHLLSQALRLVLLRHYHANPVVTVSAAVRSGDWAAVKKRLSELPSAAVEALVADAKGLSVCDVTADAGEQPSRKPKSRASASPSTLEPVMLALKSLHKAVLTWQLALHWLRAAAAATQRAGILRPQAAEQLAWWPLVTGASQPEFITPGTTPGPGGGGHQEPPSTEWPQSVATGRTRQRSACFGSSATARAAAECASAVARLPSDAAAALVVETMRLSRECEAACGGALAPHAAALAALAALQVPVETAGAEAEAMAGSGDMEEEEEDAQCEAPGRPRRKGREGQQAEPEPGCPNVPAPGRRSGRARRSTRRAREQDVDSHCMYGTAESSGSDGGDPNSAANENGPAAQRAGNGGQSSSRLRTGRAATAGAQQGRRSSRAASSSRAGKGGREESRKHGTSTVAAAEPPLPAEAAPVSVSLAVPADSAEVSAASPGDGAARRQPAVRRGHRQTAGQFLVQQAERASAHTQGQGGGNGTGTAGEQETAGARLARVLRDAWLTALQVHPCAHPCANVLYFDDGEAVLRTLVPSPRQDLHEVLSDPAAHVTLKKGVQLPVYQTFTSTAFTLLAQYGRCVDVADWLASFCLALGAPPSAGAAGSSKGRRRAPKKRKRKLKTVERSAADEDGAAADAAADAGQEGAGQCVVDLEKGGEAMHALYVYFYQAVKHLMYYGIVKRCKRRTGRFWKREIFPPDVDSLR